MNGVYSKYLVSDKEKEKDSTNPNDKLLPDNDECHEGDKLIKEGHDYIAIGEKFEIDPNRLIIMKPIGKGYFSDVHMGMLSAPNKDIPVAVKTTQIETNSMNAKESENVLRRQRQALRDELNIFTHLQSLSTGGHENVLKLLGVITTIRTDFSLLTEYCECGSMDRFLQAKLKNGDFMDELIFETNENEKVREIQRDSNWRNDYQSRRESGLITTSDLLWFALQIARGMQFLAAMNVLHRDIALRNVLLKSDFTLKVADFGLSRKLKESDDAYYIWNNGAALPIRYIAPESLKSHRSAITSEYWSFGVVIWELFTFAEKKPYDIEFENYESNLNFYEFLVEHLSSGHRLSVPDICPQQIKSLLLRLWHSDPKKRPSFLLCQKVITHELMQSRPNILVKKIVSHNASDYSLLRVDDEDLNEGTTKSLDSTLLEDDISALPLREIQQTESNGIRERKKVKCLIVISMGLLAVVLITILTTFGFTLLNKTGVPDIFELAKKYTIAAKAGDPEAQFHLGVMYENGQGVRRSSEIAGKWYEMSAEQGFSLAQNNLGLMYEHGNGVNQSNEKAIKWYSLAAKQGEVRAQNNLGKMYQEGKGVNQSYTAAVKYFKKAAERGSADALYNLGWAYQNGLGVTKSDEEAVKWYRKAAEKGLKTAQNNLGIMYENGKGVNQSDEEAVIWYQKAAVQGDTDAQNSLGKMYQEGKGVNESDEEAVKWYLKAAEQGNEDAQNNLGKMYQEGRGVPQSDVVAAKWYGKAAEKGKRTG